MSPDASSDRRRRACRTRRRNSHAASRLRPSAPSCPRARCRRSPDRRRSPCAASWKSGLAPFLSPAAALSQPSPSPGRPAAVQLLRIEGAPPLVYATLPGRSSKTTIAFYAHYDGQPVDPAQWATPPWQPVMRGEGGEARIYARSASDDKAPIMAMLAALDALKAARVVPAVNLKFVFEGEEEA